MSETMQQIVQSSLDSVTSTLNSKGNSYYLPTWLAANGYDPYGNSHAMLWDFVLNGAEMTSAASDICGDIQEADSTVCTGTAFYIGDSGQPPTLTLGGSAAGQMTVAGFSNAVINSLVAENNEIPMTISAQLAFSTLSNAPANPVVSGNFSLLQYCCCSTDQATCANGGTSTSYTGNGTFVATVTGSCTANITLAITNLADRVLDFSVQKLELLAPLDKNGDPNIATQVTITDSNIPSKALPSYNNLAEEAFNSSEGRQQILAQINAIMNAEGQLAAIGTALTKIVDGYLQTNNKYPYGAPSFMLY